MSTEIDQTQVTGEGDTETQVTNESADIRQLREKAKRSDALELENARYKQQAQLREAGLDLNDKQLKALNAAHDGESNPDAWRKTAEELGFARPAEETSTDEQKAHQQVQNASAGSTTKAELTPEDAYAQANTPAEVLAIARERGSVVADDLQ